jgi:hypothetical protein
VSVEYPIFVFEKDDRSMRLIESEERILSHLEAIDIENNEYVFWDANGRGVSISVSVGSFKSELKSVTSYSESLPIHDAFKLLAEGMGIQESLTDGAPIEVWRRIQERARKPSERAIRNGID